ncbi:MAG TPA: TraB/GumN family protein [Povalibacter sp.]|uniref:TraB/GumN family protein n=1 Tax=Povalibacter sp. TaxID=1962978 RepID=UPI002C8C589D|nr:TraB/GumN family protein [Povalibacter sp.]HMN45322.1 TraB/GumN family protein [Povalibacter sp.]
MPTLSRFLASLLVLALVQTASAADSAPARHALWSLQGKTNTVYLLGSVHFLKPSDELPAALDAAYRDAERLVMEIDMDDLDPLVAQQTTMDLGLLPDGKTLESELGSEAYQLVSKQARVMGIDPALLNRFRPWLAAMTLVQLQLMKQGLDPQSGVEQRLTARAVADHKEITGLETLQQQLGMLAGLSSEQQREFLLYSVENAEHAAEEIDELIDAWRRGDTTVLARLLAEGFDKYPDLYRPLTVDRNRQWLGPIEELLKSQDDYLVVVGALHLVGKDSVIDLLESKGHKVTQH